MLDRAEQQLFLIGEVVVDGALRDARRLTDMLEACVAVPSLREHGQRRVQYLVRPIVGAAFPAECSDGHGGARAEAVCANGTLSTLEYNILRLATADRRRRSQP